MSDFSLPIDVTVPIAVTLLGAIGALWRELRIVKKTAEDAADKRVLAAEEAANKRVEAADAEKEEYKERWIREVKLGAQRAAMVRRPEEPPPAKLPPPDWQESTEVRNLRAELEGAALDGELQHYLESTPPRPRQKSRPDR